MPYSHDGAVLGPGGHLQLPRAAVLLDDQAVIACSSERAFHALQVACSSGSDVHSSSYLPLDIGHDCTIVLTNARQAPMHGMLVTSTTWYFLACQTFTGLPAVCVGGTAAHMQCMACLQLPAKQ